MHLRSPLASPLAMASVLILAAIPALADDCDHRAERQARQDAAGVSRVEIFAKAGDLRIDGSEAAKEIRAQGKACASTQKLVDEIELSSRLVGDVLRIEVDIPNTKGWSQQARLDLEVSLPADLPVSIDDGSGDTQVRGATVAEIEDGSGDLRIENARGDARIDDGSGDVTIADFAGSLEIEDGSGDVNVRRLQGSIRVTSDGSGDLEIEDVTGNVRIDDDGSGDIVARSVGGDFIVEDDGSGEIRHRQVQGRVDIPADD